MRDDDNNQNLVSISRRLAFVLRHGALERGVRVHEGGYVRVSDLLALPEFRGVTREVLGRIVADDPKTRYALSPDTEMIRAHQGHSFAVPAESTLLRRVSDPAEIPTCVHGTYRRFLPSIMKDGLRRMRRQHIHFSSGPGAKSGMRRDCDVRIYVDAARAMADGCPFFLSENGVILSPGFGATGAIPARYFSRVLNGQSQTEPRSRARG